MKEKYNESIVKYRKLGKYSVDQRNMNRFLLYKGLNKQI